MRLAAIAGLVVGLWPIAPTARVPTAEGTAASGAGAMRPLAAPGISALHRIAVRSLPAGPAEFFDTVTGKTFIPRGNNYIRLRNGYHSTFDAGTYDPSGAEAALSEMRRHGY